MRKRKDSWNEEHDLVLAETVLRYVRQGKTQLEAFDEVAESLNRTVRACAFRWNKTVRQQYESALDIAKTESRKKHGRIRYTRKRKDAMKLEDPKVSEEALNLKSIIQYLKSHQSLTESLNKELKGLQQEIAEKDKEISNLKEENEKLKTDLFSIDEIKKDYEALLKIMDKARKQTFLENEEEKKQVFRMEANGNLVRVEGF